MVVSKCEHDKRFRLFGLPKEAGGCLACAHEQVHAELAALREEVEDQAGLIKRLSDLLNSAVNVLRGPPPDDTLWSFHDVAERAEALRARVAELEADAEAGRKLWAYMVKNRLPWSDYDLQDALTAIGLLVAKDMDGEDEAQQCLNCDGDCHTCYRVSETLLVERATERQRPAHE